MDNETIYTRFSDLENELKKAGSKHIKLQDSHHKDIVPFNPAKSKPAPKIAEIKRKLQNLPAGIYCIIAQDRFGKNVHQDNFYFGKGKYSPVIPQQQPLNENNNNNNSNNLLSLESAVENIRTSADLKAENLFLKKENEELKKRVATLEQENQHLSEVNEELSSEEEGVSEQNSPFAGLGEFFKELSPIIPSLADKYFEHKKQDTDYKKAKLLLDNGYDIPGMSRTRPVKNGNGQQKKQMPQPGTPEWEQYVDEVLNLDEEAFDKHLALIEQKFPHLYPALCESVYEEEEEEEQN